jgi:hypothetical protein
MQPLDLQNIGAELKKAPLGIKIVLIFFKKRVSVDELAKKAIYTCANIIYEHQDPSVMAKWLHCHSITELKSLIKEPPIVEAIQKQFNSPEFHKNFQKLSEKQLEQVKTAIYYSFIEMREFIERRITIRMGQAETQKNSPGMRVSWRFPEFNEYPEQFLKIKSVLA